MTYREIWEKGGIFLMEDTMLKANQLQLADVVQLFEGGYGIATVKQIRDEQITFFRPYVATSDFEMGGHVICTIGIEEVVYQLNTTTMFKLIERRKIPLR